MDAIAKIALERLVAEVATNDIAVIEEGNLPTVPCNPDLCKKILLGAVSGILFSVGFLALGHLQKGSSHNIESMEQYDGCTHSLVNSLRRKLGGVRKERSSGRKNNCNNVCACILKFRT